MTRGAAQTTQADEIPCIFVSTRTCMLVHLTYACDCSFRLAGQDRALQAPELVLLRLLPQICQACIISSQHLVRQALGLFRVIYQTEVMQPAETKGETVVITQFPRSIDGFGYCRKRFLVAAKVSL
jgi:hypothetical protein